MATAKSRVRTALRRPADTARTEVAATAHSHPATVRHHRAAAQALEQPALTRPATASNQAVTAAQTIVQLRALARGQVRQANPAADSPATSNSPLLFIDRFLSCSLFFPHTKVFLLLCQSSLSKFMSVVLYLSHLSLHTCIVRSLSVTTRAA